VPGANTAQIWGEHAQERKREWNILWAVLPRVDDVTLQPRNFNIPEEANVDRLFLDLIRTRSPDVQPWLFAEWVERERPRPSDKGEVPSLQMSKVFPALTWEESMGAMLLYVEDLRSKIAETDKGAKPVRVLPSNLAMGWLRHRVEHGDFPGVKPQDFYAFFFRDGIHPNPKGAYLVDLTWYAAFYGESPEGQVLPVGLDFTPRQTAALQRLAWDVIQNYPDAGIFQEGKTACGAPRFTPTARAIGDVLPVTLESSTPDAWFRYTLDGTAPTRMKGYVYCGVVSVRPGMTVKAVAFKNGMADSPISEANFAVDPAKRLSK
jgi:hypothetical protein